MADESVQRWLASAVTSRGDVAAAVLLLRRRDGSLKSVPWPTDAAPDEHLRRHARAHLEHPDRAPPPHDGVILRTVRHRGEAVGAIAMRLAHAERRATPMPPATPAPPPVAAPPDAAPTPPWPVAAPAAALAAEPLSALLRRALAADGLERCAAVLATELARLAQAERVAIGLADHRFVRVRAVSDGAQLERQQALVQALGRAMDEAVDQAATLWYPPHPDDRPRITLAHADLAQRHGAASVLTVPLAVDGTLIGAITFERRQPALFDAAAGARFEALAADLAPLLKLQLDLDRSALQRLRARWRERTAAAPPARRRALVLLPPLAAAAVAAAAFAWPVPYPISAPTRLEGQVQRALVAPVDSFLKSVHVRAGDSVVAGQLLAELADDDLRLERRRAESEVARHESAYVEAQANADRAALVMADARVAEARALLALIDQQLARTQVTAPFDGRVIGGDLANQLGAPVRRGDLLFTLTPSAELRVMLQVDERDVARLQPGATGAVTLSALPERRFDLVVERVMPVARVEGGRNVFEAEARLRGDAGDAAVPLRPGMQGVARVDAGERPLAGQWLDRALGWLRLQWWAWVGR